MEVSKRYLHEHMGQSIADSWRDYFSVPTSRRAQALWELSDGTHKQPLAHIDMFVLYLHTRKPRLRQDIKSLPGRNSGLPEIECRYG